MGVPVHFMNNVTKFPACFINVGVGVDKNQKMSPESLYVKDTFKGTDIYGIEADRDRYRIVKPDFPGKMFWAALGDTDEPITMYKDPCGSGLDMVIGSDIGNEALQINTPGFTLDTFCKNQGIKGDIFLWCDCEGYELKILKGATDLLASGRIPYMLLELWVTRPYPDPQWAEAKDIIELLDKYDYEIIAKNHGNKYDALFKIRGI